MGTFNSSRTFPLVVEDLAPVAQDLMQHFEQQGYDVTGEPIPTGGWTVSIRKGNLFKAILGMKTALNVEIEPASNGTTAKAGIGIFGQQAAPTMITLLVVWPVLLTQLWGMAQQQKLDEEALATVERGLVAHSK
jgi:hypothetical protein